MVTLSRSIALSSALWLATAPALAADPEAEGETSISKPGAVPSVHHAPISTAEPHETLVVSADIRHPELLKRALLVYREPSGDWLETPFQRSGSGYVASVPAKTMKWPHLDYTIEIETLDEKRYLSFATRDAPHRILVPEDVMDVRERALSERLEGRRSVVDASGEYVRFGDSPAQVNTPAGLERRDVADQYYRIESSYTYRPLRAVNEFSIRVGVVRGESPVPGVNDTAEFDVGLNYAAASVRLRLTDHWHLEGQGLTSVTEVGFSLGGGGALHVGDPFGSKLVVGFEAIEVFGARFFSRVDILAHPRLKLSPIIEVTDMPHADKYGIRLLGELGIEIGGGLGARVRGGYQARQATSGGPSAGAGLSYAF